MNNLKRMPVKVRKELQRAGEWIASKKVWSIHEAIKAGHVDIYDTNEFQMFSGSFLYQSKKAKLIMIALMLTMPLDIINHKCKP